MSLPHSVSRRTFLKSAGAAALAAPFFAKNLHAQAPSRVLRHASFGLTYACLRLCHRRLHIASIKSCQDIAFFYQTTFTHIE